MVDDAQRYAFLYTPYSAQLQQLAAYINGSGSTCVLYWSMYRLSVRRSPARNNVLESFHLPLRRRIKVAYPSLYAFLGHLSETLWKMGNEWQRLWTEHRQNLKEMHCNVLTIT